MINLLISLGAMALTMLALALPRLLSFGEAALPGALVLIITYMVLARRTFKQVEKIFVEASSALQTMPPRLELAINTLEKAYAFGRRQFGVKSQVDTQIGIILFLQQEFNKALPYLKRSLGFGHWLGGAMLGVIYYKKKDHEEMKKTFSIVLKKAKKQDLAWNLYAYLLCQLGEAEAAQKLLADAVKKTGNNERIKESLLALQNNKKLKLRAYKEQWYQFHLERPPADYQQQPAFAPRMSKIARRGRW